ncbi:MAG: trypsin-like peptidase domain-containing protein [Thermoleophilaceae bacterium]|nr:trypsin-like peptidase domain-containing protein [Thermoleophilaceae bacterium]
MDRRPSRTANVIAGAGGGALVALVFGVLIATGAIDTGDGDSSRAPAREQAPLPRSSTGDGEARRDGELTVGDIYKRDSGGVVFIQANADGGQDSPFGLPGQEGAATGSGFVVDEEGTILTNAHVVEGATEVRVKLGTRDAVDAKVAGSDRSSDLAVLKADPKELRAKPLPLGSSKDVRVGDTVVAIGNPFGFDNTVTTGIVSALQRQIEAPDGFAISDVIQTDAAINPGNSGGPLLDAAGRVIGINSQIATGGSGGSVGIAFAIPIDQAKAIVPQLKKEGQVERAYLGVTTADVSQEVANELDLPSENGALVQAVEKGGPAERAGIRAGSKTTSADLIAGGDLIVAVDGREIDQPADVSAAIADNKPGDEVRVEYFRGKDREIATVKVGTRPKNLGARGGGGSRPPEDTFPVP